MNAHCRLTTKCGELHWSRRGNDLGETAAHDIDDMQRRRNRRCILCCAAIRSHSFMSGFGIPIRIPIEHDAFLMHSAMTMTGSPVFVSRSERRMTGLVTIRVLRVLRRLPSGRVKTGK